MNNTTFKKYFLPSLLLISIVLVQIFAAFPAFVEKYYSNFLFQYISKGLRLIFGKLPFSFGDVLYISIILYLIYYFVISILRKKKWTIKQSLLNILSVLGVFYFLFNFLWALNYHRQPITERLNFSTEYTSDELLAFTKILIEKTNQLQEEITSDKDEIVVIPYSTSEIYKLNLAGYKNLEKENSEFAYSTISVKNSIFSIPLSYMGFAGYLNPFTNEAQVNSEMPKYSIASTASHEMAHQIGIASESEANFVGFLATIHNPDLHIKYSGYTMALRYCLGALKFQNEQEFQKIFKTINPGILKNFQESEDFWNYYSGKTDKFFSVFYDNFLKANKQEDGLEGYSKFVDLLIGYYKINELPQ